MYICGALTFKIIIKMIIDCVVHPATFVHSSYRYPEFKQVSTFDFVLVIAEICWKFAFYAGQFLYYASIMLYAFQPLLC